MKNAYLVQMRAKEEKMYHAREEEVHVSYCKASLCIFTLTAAVPCVSSIEARMREELLKKFAEDDRLEQLNEHKRRMKAVNAVGNTSRI